MSGRASYQHDLHSNAHHNHIKMFAKIFALFALIAVALAAPEPKAAPAPEPAPQFFYSGLDYAYPAVAAPVASPYAAPVYSAYSAYPTYYVKK